MNAVTGEIVTLDTYQLLTFDIGIFRESPLKPEETFWEKSGGTLDIGDIDGAWLYKGSRLPFAGINLYLHREDKHYWESVASATLIGVPYDFYKNMNCGETYSGTGYINLTNQQLEWRMYFPCV